MEFGQRIRLAVEALDGAVEQPAILISPLALVEGPGEAGAAGRIDQGAVIRLEERAALEESDQPGGAGVAAIGLDAGRR
jgi:hypothetical protein